MKPGDKLPDFTAVDQDLNNITSEDILGKPSVLFFYPKDGTKGCTKQACAFRDHYKQFEEAGARVIGISSDSAESHRKFQEKHNLPFTLICDRDGQLRKKLGVANDLFGLIPGRETFLFDENGKLIHRFNSQLNFERHAEEAIQSLKNLVNLS